MAFDAAFCALDKVNFLGVAFTPLDGETAFDKVCARAAYARPFAYVATPNVDHIVGLSVEPARRTLYEHAWLTLNDSRVLQALARRARLHLPAATGADLAEQVLARIIHRDEPVTIIGGDQAMIAGLKRRYGLTDLRWHNPPMGLKLNPRAIVEAAAFAAAQPSRFTFICVGAPQQEMVAYALAQRGDACGVGLCVGGALDFLSGRTRRAPLKMRELGLEWLHRLMCEPRRLWRRYLVDGPRVFSLFSAWRASMASAKAI